MRAKGRELMEFWLFLFKRFLDDKGFNSAAALTYTTLFAVVPLMTVTFTMLSAVPAFSDVGEDIQNFIFKNFIPSAGETVQSYLQGFTTQARQLTWIGVVVLAVTALTMLLTIEKAFNTIWRVRQARRGVSSFLLYWAILSLGPILLGVGFLVSTYVTSLTLLTGPGGFIQASTLLSMMPLFSSVLAFTLLYATVPNARVPFRHALIGGAFAAVLFEAAKGLFALYVSLFPSYQLIYGAFATVPLFLLWIYLSWVIVLFGAEMVCNLSFSRSWHKRAVPKLLVALGILRLFYDRQRAGESLSYSAVQRSGWNLPEEEWNEVLDFFEQQKLICPTSQGRWALCRDFNQVSLYELLGQSPWPWPLPTALPEHLEEPWYPALKAALLELDTHKQRALGQPLSHWFGEKEQQ